MALLASARTGTEAKSYILDALVRKVSRSLMMPQDEVEVKRSVSSFGIDLLIAVELRNWLVRETKVELPVFDILQALNLSSLTDKVTRRTPLIGNGVKEIQSL